MAYNGYNDAKKECNKKYIDNHDRIFITLSKGKKEEIKKRASEKGMSISAYMISKALE